jgi:hypothetical protein
VREDETVKVPQVYPEFFRIGKEQPREPSIKEDLLVAGLDEEREPGFAHEIIVRECSVIDKDGKGEPGRHGEISLREGDETFLFMFLKVIKLVTGIE